MKRYTEYNLGCRLKAKKSWLRVQSAECRMQRAAPQKFVPMPYKINPHQIFKNYPTRSGAEQYSYK